MEGKKSIYQQSGYLTYRIERALSHNTALFVTTVVAFVNIFLAIMIKHMRLNAWPIKNLFCFYIKQFLTSFFDGRTFCRASLTGESFHATFVERALNQACNPNSAIPPIADGL